MSGTEPQPTVLLKFEPHHLPEGQIIMGPAETQDCLAAVESSTSIGLYVLTVSFGMSDMASSFSSIRMGHSHMFVPSRSQTVGQTDRSVRTMKLTMARHYSLRR